MEKHENKKAVGKAKGQQKKGGGKAVRKEYRGRKSSQEKGRVTVER